MESREGSVGSCRHKDASHHGKQREPRGPGALCCSRERSPALPALTSKTWAVIPNTAEDRLVKCLCPEAALLFRSVKLLDEVQADVAEARRPLQEGCVTFQFRLHPDSSHHIFPHLLGGMEAQFLYLYL